MRFSIFTRKLLALAETVHRWLEALGSLDDERREKVARYAEDIADTLARASEAYARLEADAGDKMAARQVVRELGRISGYLETLVQVLRHHLDGRKLSGVIRRLEQLGPEQARASLAALEAPARVDRLIAAEGYFRGLADGLRA